MSTQVLAAWLVGQQRHESSGGAVHLALLAGVVVAGLVVFGISRWRARRDATDGVEQSEEDR